MGLVPERLRGFIKAWQDYPLPEGKLIGGRYVIQHLLGEGSYGLTYCCRDTAEGELYALKQSRPSKKDAGRMLLEKEYRILQSMDHPRIPACRDYLEFKGSNWLASDYITGKTLEDLIFDDKRIYGERESLAVILKLAELVMHVHSRGYVHLDLRIPNVILREDDLYLIDFGLAKRIGEQEDSSGPDALQTVVLPERMPPVISSDLYDMGQLMLFMLYSAYEPERGKQERSWREELKVSPDMLVLLNRLLGEHAEPYADTADFIRDAEAIHQSLVK
ncbi:MULTISPECIES: protein kinase [unclassified Paenibacillus]|uniref:serine/threonine protein kinase n=1 Tax=unclassified Paenibacillus TaxID=185978 RepID=UPI0024049456|nr:MULTISPECIES: protein kinase [unclassified Paenibacillus]MDF9841836.1 serine/threonine protein kinase [Paenibacillus sp. PastF-2]MDF9848483.1 serine/threonine protein kinase [Paenibacillus sp. PastM-2]MDF9854996.1 serine/threonine protein kinase [Paenibacillus sp. PastF-1]MDH6480265.1 serine/threonine protein kinase [Paenibacillus sp. PastH-2]MDH6507751.1 serine/threonine protein kinase [Paenibacillus sp. PastM-3]